MIRSSEIFGRQIITVFLVALIIRGIVLSIVVDRMSVIYQPDSKMYISLAEGLKQYGSFVYAETPARPDVERMPGYPLLLAVISILGAGSFFPAVVFQVFLDSLSCLLVYLLAEKVWKDAGFISGLLAAVDVGMITYAHFILNDSLFLFLFLIILILIFRLFEDPGYKIFGALGGLMGVAVMVRPVIMYLPFFLIPFFFICFVYRLRIPWLPTAGRILVFGIVFLLFLSPWMARNYFHYGRFKLSAQGGEHLLQYIVPFVWQYSKGIPFIEGMKKANEIFDERVKAEGIDVQTLSPFEKSHKRVSLALEILKGEPKTAVIKAWFLGAVKNIFAPSIIDFSYLLRLERPHFFYTKGKTLFERGWNFIRGIKGFFGWVVIASLVGVVLWRILQLWGLFLLLRKKKWEALMCILIIGYFLLVSGPVGYAKYRLPFEPLLIIFLAIGLKDIYERWRKAQGLRLKA